MVFVLPGPLLTYLEFIGCRWGEIRAIGLDISKTFNEVWHAELLHKLTDYGVVDPILSILESFLQECSLKDVLDGQSSPLHDQCGSSSGISFGSILFLVFINDLPNEVLSRIGIYADNTTLYSILGMSGLFAQVESAGELELDLQSIVEWGDK